LNGTMNSFERFWMEMAEVLTGLDLYISGSFRLCHIKDKGGRRGWKTVKLCACQTCGRCAM
jgi:hypothetical protein